MKRNAIMFSLVSISLLFAGCAFKSGNDSLNTKTKSEVESGIVKGKTTKDDIKSMFGEPQNTDFMNNGNEKWTYTHVTKEMKAVDYIPVANWFVSGTNDTTKSLVILFDDNGVVKNYAYSVAEGESKGGLIGGTAK